MTKRAGETHSDVVHGRFKASRVIVTSCRYFISQLQPLVATACHQRPLQLMLSGASYKKALFPKLGIPFELTTVTWYRPESALTTAKGTLLRVTQVERAFQSPEETVRQRSHSKIIRYQVEDFDSLVAKMVSFSCNSRLGIIPNLTLFEIVDYIYRYLIAHHSADDFFAESTG